MAARKKQKATRGDVEPRHEPWSHVQPLDGGYKNYISTLEKICKYVNKTESLSRDKLKNWYWKKHREWQAHNRSGDRRPRNDGDSFDGTTSNYINFLFRCGLLKENGKKIQCTFLRVKDKNRKIIEIMNENIYYILDMLEKAKEPTTVDDLMKDATLSENQILFRRGWLESAGMVEVVKAKGNKLRTTSVGKQFLKNHGKEFLDDGLPELSARNPAEYNGRGEGPEHKKLKEYVCSHCAEVLRDHFSDVENVEGKKERELRSGDRVDVTASNMSTVWHIEVKSKISSRSDIERGLYQCIKYKAVGKAMERTRPTPRKVKSVLVVGKAMPNQLKDLARKLRVRVIVCVIE